ncbi:MAG: hypothetical protein ACM3X6_08085 [Patescibacteria group bacterium]
MPSREESGGDLHLKRWCALPEPYPEPMVLAPNQYYAMLLLEDYTGQVSEMTAINQYLYWSAGYVYYGCGICDRLAADIGAEIAAIQTHRQHQQLIADPNIQSLLGRIILDEEHHRKLFREAYGKYCPGG